jgi:hypothetical protein
MKSFSRAQQIVLMGISLAILLASVPRRLDGPLGVFSSSKIQPRQQWAVEVTGAVRSPGIYTFSDAPTAGQAIEKAGGIRGNPSVNLFLSQMDVTKRLVLGVPVDLNQAGLDEIAIVPGISRGLARRIIGFRESRNGFKTWYDLMGVRGVGPRNVKGFQDYLRLGEVSTSE